MVPSDPPPTSAADMRTSARWWHALRPAPSTATLRERWRAALGACLGIILAGLVTSAIAPAGSPWPWLVAPMGASAVLVFAVPSSPLAQPWAVLAGNTLSALVGVVCASLIASTTLAAGVAVGAAIVVMFATRSLHPPGGASALLVALTGVTDPRFAIYPVMVNALLLAAVGVVYNHATRRPYPHAQLPDSARDQGKSDPGAAALDAALQRYDQVLDVARDDMLALIESTQDFALQRRWSALRCVDAMSRDPIAVHADTPLAQAWGLLRTHGIKALPVIDAGRSVIGIVTQGDFMRAAGARHPGADDAAEPVAPPTHVGQIMTRRVRVAGAERPLLDMLNLFGSTGHHHLPVVDGQHTLVGMLTQSDLVAALARQPARS